MLSTYYDENINKNFIQNIFDKYPNSVNKIDFLVFYKFGY